MKEIESKLDKKSWSSRGFGSKETKALINPTDYKLYTDKIKTYFYAKDPYEAKYKFLVNKRIDASLKHYNGFKAFIE